MTLSSLFDLILVSIIYIISLHYLDAVHRCGLLLQMLHIENGLCLSLGVGHKGELWKMAKLIEMPFGWQTGGPKDPYIRWAPRSPWEGQATFEGIYASSL